MGAIVSDDYRNEQNALRTDPIIQKMARELQDGLDSGKVQLSAYCHEHSEASGAPGTPRHWFMKACIDEYVSRCRAAGVEDKHRTIGSVAEAVLALATGNFERLY